ncbi:MAG: metal ABC transporter ATP-binding protein [Actinobacteria bacterium]|nr:metal ABC transporter ATP-binding protein [Actinomycetota bacterium]
MQTAGAALHAPDSLAVVARSLTVELGGKEALTDLSFELPTGSSVALLGPNGAGKTTLFRAAVGLVQPVSGSIEPGSGPVAFVPQRLELEPSFPATVRDVVRMGRYGELGWLGRFGERDRALVDGAIEELGIAALAERRFGDLSGGERQRALLAQATAQDARLLLLDEPFAGLDAPTNQALRDRIRRWRHEGRTIVVATHDLQSASRDYDLVICLNRRLVAIGPPAEACTEEVLGETFAGRVVRVGELLIDTAHHHHGAG